MKIYLASKFALKYKIIELFNYLTDRGFEIPCTWWFDNIKGIPVTDEEWYKHPAVIEVSNRDYKGVDDANALILVSDNNTPVSFNGANVELGYAIAKGKKVFILGKVDRNALYSLVTFCKDREHLLKELNKFKTVCESVSVLDKEMDVGV